MSDIRKVVDNINIFKKHYSLGRIRAISEVSPDWSTDYVEGLMVCLSEELLKIAMKLVSAGVLGKATNSVHHLAFYFDLEFLKMHREFVRKYFDIEDINYIIHNKHKFPFIYFRFERRKLMAYVRSHCPFVSYSDSFITLDPLGRRGNTIAERIITIDKFSSLRNFLNECLCNLDTFLVRNREPLDYKGDVYELFDSTG